MTDKQKYIQLCTDEYYSRLIPVFSKPFWLDAVAENWDVVLHTEDDKIIAALPFCWKGNFITKRIYLPDLSFYQSILFLKDNLTQKQKNKITGDLFEQLPKTVKSYFKFLPENIDIDISNLGYKRKDYHSYFITNQTKLNVSTNHKRNIQKGIKNKFIIQESINVHLSFSILQATFIRQKIKPKIEFKNFNAIVSLSKKYACGKLVDCIDAGNNLLASAFIAEDETSSYYLFGGYNVEFKNSGAMTFLLNHLIQNSVTSQKDFNFCGSSKKSIASFFEGFGANKADIAIWEKTF